MKYIVKLGLLATTLMTVTTSAFALVTQGGISYAEVPTATVPEPGSLVLLAAGLVVLAVVKRKK
ncbi:MAG: PEP-CTERM sorting domain-containing protein [Gammaproteobacteria bacterium]|jgi:hypothetical protein